jgi:hypothetical protein
VVIVCHNCIVMQMLSLAHKLTFIQSAVLLISAIGFYDFYIRINAVIFSYMENLSFFWPTVVSSGEIYFVLDYLLTV